MNVEILLFEDFTINIVLVTDGTDEADCRTGRFLHHTSHLSCKFNFSLSGHHIDLNLEGISPHTGPGKTSDDSYLILFIDSVQRILLLS